MAFKLKGITFGKGTGSESPKKLAQAMPKSNWWDVDRNQQQEQQQEQQQNKMPAVGTEERKAEYDRRGWAYDDTIPGYGAKSDPTQADEKPPAEEQVSDQPQEQDHGSYAEGDGQQKPFQSFLEKIQQGEKQQGAPSPEVERPEYQQRRQQARLDRRKRKAGTSDTYDIRTDKKEARMKHGRGSKEFKKYKQELKEARRSRRQERRANR